MFKVAELSGNRPLTAVIFSVLQVPPPPLFWIGWGVPDLRGARSIKGGEDRREEGLWRHLGVLEKQALGDE